MRHGLRVGVAALALALGVVGSAPGSARAVPTLQLYIEGSTYDAGTATWTFQGDNFKLWVIGDVGNYGTIFGVKLTAAYAVGLTGNITITPTQADPLLLPAPGDSSTPQAPIPQSSPSSALTPSGLCGSNGTSETIPCLASGQPLPQHGQFGTGIQWKEALLGDFTLTDSPVGDYISAPPTQFPDLGQINVYDVALAGFPSGAQIHFDAFAHVAQANGGTNDVFAPFSHDAQASAIPGGAAVPLPASLLLVASGLAAFWGLRRIRGRVSFRMLFTAFCRSLPIMSGWNLQQAGCQAFHIACNLLQLLSNRAVTAVVVARRAAREIVKAFKRIQPTIAELQYFPGAGPVKRLYTDSRSFLQLQNNRPDAGGLALSGAGAQTNSARAGREEETHKGEKTMRKLAMVMALLLGLAASPGRALAGPEVLHIGPGAGTACAEGGCFTFPVGSPTEVNGLGATNRLDIFENGAGQPTLQNPLLLILGIPNVTGAAPTLAGVTSYNPYPAAFPASGVAGSGTLGGPNVYAGAWDTTTGFAGSFTAASPQGVYDFIGLTAPASPSQRFNNWHDAELAVNGIDAASFGIYVYSLTTTISGKGLVDVTFNSMLPLGTFAVAYGCGVSGATCPQGDTFGTPFTQAGLVTGGGPPAGVPEPASIFLVGTGLVGYVVGGLWRKKRQVTIMSGRTTTPVRTFPYTHNLRKRLDGGEWSAAGGVVENGPAPKLLGCHASTVRSATEKGQSGYCREMKDSSADPEQGVIMEANAMKFRRIVPVLVLLAALLGLGPRAAAAAPILFDFNTLAAGVNSAAGADPIDTYMTATYGSAVTVNLGAKTLTGTPEAGHPAATELYLGNSDGAPDRGPLAGSPYAHPSPPDTYLINRWNATSLPANVRDRIVITFVTTPITSVEFDWEIFPQNGAGDADLTVKADGNPIFFAALTTSAEKLLGDLGHVGPVTFTTPVHTLEFIDWTTAPDGLDNLRVTPAAGPSPVPAPGTGLLLGVGLAGLAALRPGFRGAMTPLARRPGGPADALRP